MDRNNETIRLAMKAADAWRTTDTYHQAAQIIDMLISALEGDPTLTPPNEWVSVEEAMPPEHDSIFKKLRGTSDWASGMFEKMSDNVNVAVKFEDGRVKVCTAHTVDGKWRNLPLMGKPVVTHWMYFPEPPDCRPPEGEEEAI